MDASKDLFEPAVTSEFLGANFVLMIDVILLDLNPVVAEAAAKQVRPCNVIFRGDEQLEARFAVVGGGCVKKWVVFESTMDADHQDHLQIWLGVELGEWFAKRIEKCGLALNASLTGKNVGCSLDGLQTGRT
jgi:hypothetical protein